MALRRRASLASSKRPHRSTATRRSSRWLACKATASFDEPSGACCTVASCSAMAAGTSRALSYARRRNPRTSVRAEVEDVRLLGPLHALLEVFLPQVGPRPAEHVGHFVLELGARRQRRRMA